MCSSFVPSSSVLGFFLLFLLFWVFIVLDFLVYGFFVYGFFYFVFFFLGFSRHPFWGFFFFFFSVGGRGARRLFTTRQPRGEGVTILER